MDPFTPPPLTQALLFDADGTLVDTWGLHRAVWTDLFSRYDFTVTDEWWEQYANLPLVPMVRAVVPEADEDLAHELNRQGTEVYLESLHLIDRIDEVVEVARRFHGRLPLAVVTGGYRDVVVPTLEAAGIAHLFDAIVTADDVVHSKPAPDVYRLAADLLGADPARCVAFEDSDVGLESARGAGIGTLVDIRRG